MNLGDCTYTEPKMPLQEKKINFIVVDLLYSVKRKKNKNKQIIKKARKTKLKSKNVQ